jgi:N-methylhydantoinase A
VLLAADDIAVGDLENQIADLVKNGEKELRDEGVVAELKVTASLDCRYVGQSFTLTIPWSGELTCLMEDFHRAHQMRYGHSLPLPVEVVNLRVQIEAPRLLDNRCATELSTEIAKPREIIDLPELGRTGVWLRADLAVRQRITGPAIICEPVSTTLLAANWVCQLDELGNLRLTHEN